MPLITVTSIFAVELTSFVQDKFGIQVKDTDLIAYPMNTIRELPPSAKRKAGSNGMPTVVVPIQGVDRITPSSITLSFASEEITSYKIDADS